MASITRTLFDATEQLHGVSDTPRLDAELLMAHALDMERGQMLLRKLQDPAPATFGPLLLRRLTHEPIAYITGKAEFWSLPLRVTADVLIPRSDSETLIEAAITECADRPPASILDLGTGSGALICAALSEWPDARGTAVDASTAALKVAQDNVARLGFAGRCAFAHQSWHLPSWRERHDQAYDLILCNPPYVEDTAELALQVREFEPAMALFSGPDGLDDYKLLIPQMPDLLSANGVAIFEIGLGQLEPVSLLAEDAGLRWSAHNDLAQIPRAVVVRK